MTENASTPGPVPHTMYIEPSRTMPAPGFGVDYDHEIRVALPPSYHHTEQPYPVLWVTDGSIYFELAVGVVHLLTILGEAPEMIVVGVGLPRHIKVLEWVHRRAYGFSPKAKEGWYEAWYEGLGAEVALREMKAAGYPRGPSGGSPGFLNWLVDDVRPALSAEYRMDPDDHCLFGHQVGGMFVGYALFARPGAFAKYICGSPTLVGGNFEVFKMEERHAAEHTDLKARVFFGAGERETDDPGIAVTSTIGSMTRMVETLRIRDYPSLQVALRIFAGETSVSAPPLILSWGVRTVWADVIQPKSVFDMLPEWAKS